MKWLIKLGDAIGGKAGAIIARVGVVIIAIEESGILDLLVPVLSGS